jgi:glucose/arabinose dehydrogenase
MRDRLRLFPCVLFAGAAAILLQLPSAAQQANPPAPPSAPPPSAPPPSGSPLAGRPATEGAMRLAPVPPLPAPAAVEQLPIGKLKAPRGFRIELYAAGIDNARTLRLGDKGTVFVSSRVRDKVHAIVDRGGRREIKVVASGLYRPNGIAFHNGTLYIAEQSQISKIDAVEDVLDEPPKPTVIYSDLPKDETHGWRYLAVGPDNKLYVSVGAPCNNCLAGEQHAQIRRLNLDGSGAEVVARGVRHSVGFDWHPQTRQFYFTENSRDWWSEDIPEDKLNRVTQSGKDDFGFPYCHQGNLADSEFGWGRTCDEFSKPLALMGPHTAVLGMRFYTGTMFPADYRGNILVARHGGWNRTNKTGGDIVHVKLNRDGTVRTIEPFITGFIENNSYLGRPADILVMKDGALLISDDHNGAVYRVSFSVPTPSR